MNTISRFLELIKSIKKWWKYNPHDKYNEILYDKVFEFDKEEIKPILCRCTIEEFNRLKEYLHISVLIETGENHENLHIRTLARIEILNRNSIINE